MDNAALLTAARAIITAQRGERPTLIVGDSYGYVRGAATPYETRKAALLAMWESEAAGRSWDRAVRDEFRRLKAERALAPVVRLSDTRIAA